MAENPWAASEQGAIEAMEGFMAALNAGDNQALFNTMHVPHVRISGNGVAIHNTREDLERDYLKGFAARAGDAWHHTVLDSVEVLHSPANHAITTSGVSCPSGRRMHSRTIGTSAQCRVGVHRGVLVGLSESDR